MRASIHFLVYGSAVILALGAVAGCPAGVGGTGGGEPGSTSTSTSTSTSGTGGGSSTVASSSSGMMGPCIKAEDCPPTGDPCTSPICINGECVSEPAGEGTTCDDGNWCTESDTCVAGVCTGGITKYCPPPDTCHVGVCDPVTKSCVAMPGNDGAQCDDQDPCTSWGTCSNGTCSKGGPVDCSFLDGECSVGVCDPVVGCKTLPLNDGAQCDDGLYCTINDKCSAGKCGGDPNTCAAPGDVCLIGVCDELTKTCKTTPGNNGAACDDGNDCTAGSTCSNGMCVGGQPANNGMPCKDADGCTQGTTCSNGACGNPTSTISQCINNDQCCPPGCVVNGDSDCSFTKWSEGTQNWPDQACNPQNSFGGCDTNAQNHADAWATTVCNLNGFSMGIWTGNKMGGCAGQISMWCGGVIPCQPIYENSCAMGDQTIVEITCFP